MIAKKWTNAGGIDFASRGGRRPARRRSWSHPFSRRKAAGRAFATDSRASGERAARRSRPISTRLRSTVQAIV